MAQGAVQPFPIECFILYGPAVPVKRNLRRESLEQELSPLPQTLVKNLVPISRLCPES